METMGKQIGDVARQFGISNRTLRYWEEKGIVSSTRMENGYRFYDGDSIMRIRQIVFLRKLRIPVADIERIVLNHDAGSAVDALRRHLANLRREGDILDSIAVLTERLIRYLQAAENPQHALMFPELCMDGFPDPEQALQILLSERNIAMETNQISDVRIVRLSAMTVAACHVEGETPEADCSAIVNPFVLEHGLHKLSSFRHFGFNNPNPSEGSPVYGYEIWIAVPEDFQVPAPLVKKQFSGGLYASITTGLSEIGRRWQQLCQWAKDSDAYEPDLSLQWLEECTDFETFLTGDDSKVRLDLLAPIRKL